MECLVHSRGAAPSAAVLGAETLKWPAMTIAPAALQAITRYDWPGNVRELKNAMGV